ncbi:unnamed protein product [Calypogeia fissa]
MVAIWEYRIVLPFTIEEYKIAQLYMVAKYSASESNEDNGDGVEVLKNEPFEDGDRKGQYTHKLYHLASKLPSWLVSLMPKKALTLEEEAWNAYPNCTTILKCPFFNKFRLILQTTHLADRGITDNALGLDAKTLKKRQVEFIDIGLDPVEVYVEDEDPAKFKSKRTGRGPLLEGWTQKCEPVMCAYKCVTVDVPYWGFGSQVEKFISKNAQRKILLEGHRKCFCWLDEWHGLTMEEIRRMEYETTEAMANARQIALRRAEGDNETDLCGALEGLLEEEKGQAKVGSQDDQPLTPRLGIQIPKSKSSTPYSRSSTPRSVRDFGGSPSLLRRPSLVGPSVALGIATLSASDVDDFNLGGSAPPVPLTEWSSLSSKKQKELEKDLHPPEMENQLVRNGSCESFTSVHSNSNSGAGEDSHVPVVEETQDVVAKYCVDVLDRAINWTKQRAKTSPGGSKTSGKITPLRPASTSSVDQQGAKDVEHCVGIKGTDRKRTMYQPDNINLPSSCKARLCCKLWPVLSITWLPSSKDQRQDRRLTRSR